MDKTYALEIIGLLAGVWASKTDGPISQAFAVIAKTADEAVEHSAHPTRGSVAQKGKSKSKRVAKSARR